MTMGVIGLLNPGVIWNCAREKQRGRPLDSERGRPLDSGPGDGGWLATGEEPAASAMAVAGRIGSYRARTDPCGSQKFGSPQPWPARRSLTGRLWEFGSRRVDRSSRVGYCAQCFQARAAADRRAARSKIAMGRYAASSYSWSRPPSRSRRRIRHSWSGGGTGLVLKSGGCWSSERCGRCVL